MIQRFISNGKDNLFINYLIYLVPFAAIAGQAILNIITALISIIFLLLIYKKKKYSQFKVYFAFLYFLIFFLSVNLFFSIDTYLSARAVFGFIRYYIIFLAILYCLNDIKNFRFNFTGILLVAVAFVVLDSFIQYFLHKDIFLKEISGDRLTGPFDRKVPGAYVSKLIFLSLIFLLMKKIKIKYVICISVVVLLFLVFTNERSPTFMFISTMLIFIFFSNIKTYLKTFLFFAIPLFLLLLINYNGQLKNRFVNQTKAHITTNNYWSPHFLTAIEIFKSNKIFGNGIKTFRIECQKEIYDKIKTKHINKRCSTHPHNFYLEILSETGILGILILLSVNSYILTYLIKNFFQNKNFKSEILLIFCSFFILFWPLQTTGAFFSSWNGLFYWIFFSFFFNLKERIIKLEQI